MIIIHIGKPLFGPLLWVWMISRRYLAFNGPQPIIIALETRRWYFSANYNASHAPKEWPARIICERAYILIRYNISSINPSIVQAFCKCLSTSMSSSRILQRPAAHPGAPGPPCNTITLYGGIPYYLHISILLSFLKTVNVLLSAGLILSACGSWWAMLFIISPK